MLGYQRGFTSFEGYGGQVQAQGSCLLPIVTHFYRNEQNLTMLNTSVVANTYNSDTSNPAVNDYENGNYEYQLQDTNSDPDMYGQRRDSSQESLPAQSCAGYPESSTPTFRDYPSDGDRQIPLSKEEIEEVFLDLAYTFGFQRDSMRNMASCSFLY